MPLPMPFTPWPWSLVREEADEGAWLCGSDGTALAYIEHHADAVWLLAVLQQECPFEPPGTRETFETEEET